MAYSEKIHMKQYKRLRVWLSVKKILTFLLPVGFVFAALHFSPYCPLIGTLFFSGLFTWWWFRKTQITAFFQPDWDGVVIDKIGEFSQKLDLKSKSMVPSWRCTLFVQRDSDGKIVETRFNEATGNGLNTYVIYFRMGERVRHHRCLPLYEKFDKSKERKLICFGCGRFADKYEEKCWHCGLPVLSEETEYVKKVHDLDERAQNRK